VFVAATFGWFVGVGRIVPVGLGKTGWNGVGVACKAGWNGVAVGLAPGFTESIGEVEEEAVLAFVQPDRVVFSRSNANRMMEPDFENKFIFKV